MHALAEREKQQKQIGKKNMQHQHERMPGVGHRIRQIRFQIQKTHQVFPIFFDGQFLVAIPPPGPIHLTAEYHDQKQQNKQIVILGDR